MVDAVKNFAYSTVLTGPTPSTTGVSLVLQSGDGAKFPAPPFSATMWPVGDTPLSSNAEIVRVTGLVTDTVTMTRAQEGTTNQPVVAGYQFAQTITAAFIAELLAANVVSFNTRTGAIVLLAADIEGLFTAAGQLFLGSGSGSGSLLAKGTSGYVLTAGASTASWAAPANLVNSSTTTPLTGLLSGNGSSVSAVSAPTGTVVGTSDTQTLSNKRITKRVQALSANAASVAINTDTYDVVHITGQTVGLTFSTSGTPVDGDTLRISVTGTTAVVLTWGTIFEASTVPLPTTTTGTTRLDVGFLFNTETSKWRCVATA